LDGEGFSARALAGEGGGEPFPEEDAVDEGAFGGFFEGDVEEQCLVGFVDFVDVVAPGFAAGFGGGCVAEFGEEDSLSGFAVEGFEVAVNGGPAGAELGLGGAVDGGDRELGGDGDDVEVVPELHVFPLGEGGGVGDLAFVDGADGGDDLPPAISELGGSDVLQADAEELGAGFLGDLGAGDDVVGVVFEEGVPVGGGGHGDVAVLLCAGELAGPEVGREEVPQPQGAGVVDGFAGIALAEGAVAGEADVWLGDVGHPAEVGEGDVVDAEGLELFVLFDAGVAAVPPPPRQACATDMPRISRGLVAGAAEIRERSVQRTKDKKRHEKRRRQEPRRA